MGEGSVVTWADPVTDPSGMSASWPLSTCLPLGALPGATPCARLHARAVLAEWGLGELAEAAELIVSELVTNAVRASTAPDGRPRYDGAGMPVVVLRMASDRHPGPVVAGTPVRASTTPDGVGDQFADDEFSRLGQLAHSPFGQHGTGVQAGARGGAGQGPQRQGCRQRP